MHTQVSGSPVSWSQPHALQSCWDMQLAGLSADALQLALQHGLFAQLEAFTSAQTLALQLQWDAANTAYVLELLSSLGVVECDGGATPHYRNTATSARYLHPNAEQYCGDALQFRHGVLRRVGAQLEPLLREGKAPTPDETAVKQGWAEAARLQIAQEQRAVTVEVACELVGALPQFWRAQRLLDLGGGPGLVAIALAQLHPELEAVVFEYAEAAHIAEQRIQDAGIAQRLHTMAGDLLVDDFGTGYDIIWCSSVLHFVPDIPALLARMHKALRPGGVVVCCHAEIPTDTTAAKAVLHYYLHMRMQGRQVWSAGELARAFQQAGFSTVQQYEGVRFPVAPVTAVIAQKACEGQE